ncbi:MAG: TetR family transcriptional regulator C-terminal domain-containing protein [Candidatus Lindowbacteria bacterium]|nr:TetR family transcriptional regulator C-terminal domain-containing protein [Candidatus Lindowbacteria bacterium]
MGRKSLANERRIQIAKALNLCISKYGLQKSTIKKIAEEAGVQPGILHHYFTNRDEIIGEMVETVVNEISDRYTAEINRHKNPKARFDRAVDFLFGPNVTADENTAFFYDCYAEGRRNEKVRRSLIKLYQRYRGLLIELLTETGKSAGLTAAQTKDLATLIVSIQEGVSLQWDMDSANVNLKKMCRMTKRLIDLYVEDIAQ